MDGRGDVQVLKMPVPAKQSHAASNVTLHISFPPDPKRPTPAQLTTPEPGKSDRLPSLRHGTKLVSLTSSSPKLQRGAGNAGSPFRDLRVGLPKITDAARITDDGKRRRLPIRAKSFMPTTRSLAADDQPKVFNPEPVAFHAQLFKSSNVLHKAEVSHRHSDVWSGSSSPSGNKNYILHSDRNEWNELFGSLSKLTHGERLALEFDYLSRLKSLKQRREVIPHRESMDFIMGGQKVELSERENADVYQELKRLKSMVLPAVARDLYVGRGFKLPKKHALNKPRAAVEMAGVSQRLAAHRSLDRPAEAFPQITSPGGSATRAPYQSRGEISPLFDDDTNQTGDIMFRLPPIRIKASRKFAAHSKLNKILDSPAMSMTMMTGQKPFQTTSSAAMAVYKKTAQYRHSVQAGNKAKMAAGSAKSLEGDPVASGTSRLNSRVDDAQGTKNARKNSDTPDALRIDPSYIESLLEQGPNAATDDNNAPLPTPDQQPNPKLLQGIDVYPNLNTDDIESLKAKYQALPRSEDGKLDFEAMKSQLPSDLSPAQEQYIKKIFEMSSSNGDFKEEDFLSVFSLSKKIHTMSGAPMEAFNALDQTKLEGIIAKFGELFETVDRQKTGKITLTSLHEVLHNALEAADSATFVDTVNPLIDPENEDSVSKLDYLAFVPYFLSLVP